MTTTHMPLLIGSALALAVALFARVVGFDRDRSFYATVLVIVASLYGLFAVLGGSLQSLLLESIAATAFLVLSVLGFKLSQWFLVAGLAAHGVFDFFPRPPHRQSQRALLVAGILRGLQHHRRRVSRVAGAQPTHVCPPR